MRALGAILLASAALPAGACDKAAGAPVIRLMVSSPLTVLQHGPATDVSIDAGGCVTSRFSAIDKRHGVHRFQLPAGEFAALKREVQAAKLLAFDETRIKAAAAAASPADTGVRWHVSDPDIVELTLAAGIADAKSAQAKSIRFADLQGSLMKRPDIAELQALGAVKTRLVELGSDARLQQESGR
jgi:hypothetical protein